MDKFSYEQAFRLASTIFKGDFRQVQRGKNNWVFEDDAHILNIPRHKRVRGYTIRIAVTQKLIAEGIPVAKIVNYSEGTFDRPEYLLVERVQGSILDLSTISEKEMESSHRSAGEILRRLHLIRTGGYGRLNENLVGNNASWAEFTERFFKESLERLKKNRSLWEAYGGHVKDVYTKSRHLLYEAINPSFLHADFHLGNILFNNRRVSAILDLDIVTSGDPAWDTVHYCRTFNIARKKGVRWFKRGYGADLPFEVERLYCLIIWTRKIGSQALERPEALKETIPELEKILEGTT